MGLAKPRPSNGLSTVGSVSSAMLGRPMMRRLIENSAIMVRMLASRCRILKRTLSMAVTRPASAPATTAHPVARYGSRPPTIALAATAAPSGKLPSTVRSGKLRTRNDRNTPSATRP